jgi:N-acetylglutamate synthase-like GNAT family acetyltransferase
MHIRDALPIDNHDLQALQARCPQGTTLVVSTVNRPDFFARVKAYETSRVLVAFEDDRIIGSAACAVRKATINDRPALVGYLFQAFVAPEQRRKGVASQLLRERENYLSEQGVDLIYTLIMDGNIPSMKYVESHGYDLKRSVVMPGLAVKEEMEVPSLGSIRPASVSDLEAVSELMNDTWDGFQLYEPASSTSLDGFIARTPAFSIDNLLVLEADGTILSCLGYWDWSQVMEVKVLALSWRLKLTGWLLVTSRVLPNFPGAGDILNQMMLTTIGFTEPQHLAPLVRHVNNLALDRGIQQIFCICERDHALLKSTRGFTKVDTTIHVYVKSLNHDLQFGEQPVFVDGIDL